MSQTRCENCLYNEHILESLRAEVPDEETITSLTETFKIFGDSTRIRILWSLFDRELSVSEICEEIGMSQSAVSHQLRILKQARLAKGRRNGKNTFYSLDDDHVKKIIEQVMIHVKEK